MSREKKKIVMKEGDADQFYVEKYIGYVFARSTPQHLSASVPNEIDLRIKLTISRRAVGRRPDGTSRVFEYLVKWLQWPTDTSTWYVPFTPPHLAFPFYTTHSAILP